MEQQVDRRLQSLPYSARPHPQIRHHNLGPVPIYLEVQDNLRARQTCSAASQQAHLPKLVDPVSLVKQRPALQQLRNQQRQLLPLPLPLLHHSQQQAAICSAVSTSRLRRQSQVVATSSAAWEAHPLLQLAAHQLKPRQLSQLQAPRPLLLVQLPRFSAQSLPVPAPRRLAGSLVA